MKKEVREINNYFNINNDHFLIIEITATFWNYDFPEPLSKVQFLNITSTFLTKLEWNWLLKPIDNSVLTLIFRPTIIEVAFLGEIII